MDSSDDSTTPPTLQFPVAFHSLSPPDRQRDEDSNKKRKAPIVSLMDFFPQNQRVCVGGGSSRDRVRESEDEAHDKVNTSLNLLTTGNISGSNQSMVDHEQSPKTYDERSKSENLAALEAGKERLISENQQLRQSLSQATHYIKGLEQQLFAMQQQQQKQQSTNTYQNDEHNKNASGHHLINLGLATPHHDKGESSQKEIIIKGSREVDYNNSNNNVEKPYINNSKGPRNNTGEPSRNTRDVDIQQAAEATMRKTRVSIRARTEAAVISDGCQWRKYGQKMAKGSPCPRSYYRCTMATACPVRKQVQRCAEDTSVLITTYEGNHNHPLPLAAMGMVALTSSATQLLLSGSMPSSEGLVNTDYLRALLPACTNPSSVATISASAPFPSVTIDLTKPPNPLQFPSVPSHGLQIPSVSVPSSRTNREVAEALQKIVGELMRNLNQSGPHQTMGNNNQEVERVGAVGGCNNQVRQQQMSCDQTSHDAMNVLVNNPNLAAAFADVIGSINRVACANKGKIVDGARSYMSNDDSNPSDNDGKRASKN